MEEVLVSRRRLQLEPLLTPPRGRRRDVVTCLQPSEGDTEQDMTQMVEKQKQEEFVQTCSNPSQITKQKWKAMPTEHVNEQQVAEFGSRWRSYGSDT